jgi:regulator of sigma E protease
MASRHDAETAFLEGGNEEQNARREGEAGYDPNAMIPFGPKPVPEDRWFESKPLWARIIIMIAGVVMNVVLAVVVATSLTLYVGEVTYPSTVVGGVAADTKATALTNIAAGDTIRSINGTPVSTWNEVRRQILASEGKIAITTNRGTTTVPLAGTTATSELVADDLIYYLSPVIDTVFPGEPAAAAGLVRGDSIVMAEGKPVVSWTDMTEKVSAAPGKALSLEVIRNGERRALTVTPRAVEDTDPATGKPRSVGKIGAGTRDPSRRASIPFVRAVEQGFRITWAGAGQVFRVLHQIGTGEQSMSQLGGPIAITRAAVSEARKGWADLFGLIALLSINVAVLNLLPIPILDGGQILINVLESAKGSPFSVRTRDYILRVGLFAIALLFVIVMYNDTRGAFGKLFNWVGRLFGA